MGVTDAAVTAQADGVDVRSSADPYQLHAAAQHHATTIAPITSTTLGPCNGPGITSTGAAARCYVLGPALTGVTPITNPAVQAASGAGWKLTFGIDPTQYKTFRAALGAGGTGTLGLVADGTVVLAFGSGTPALQSAIGPPLAEDQARQAAAALAVDSDLPVALQPPALPTPAGARVDVDFWTAPLGVKICGTWLANAPASGLDTGVHSHGDGLVYIHPFNQSEAGDKATLGLFLQRGGWQASADRLKLWDGEEHRSGRHLLQRPNRTGPVVGRRGRAARRPEHVRPPERAGRRPQLRLRPDTTRPATPNGRPIPSTPRRRHELACGPPGGLCSRCLARDGERCAGSSGVSARRRCSPSA
ncbi:MAG TPA: hypothetical protein VGF22_19030 [Acidimicrobiales bacterium]|jgi:hypothetical protein